MACIYAWKTREHALKSRLSLESMESDDGTDGSSEKENQFTNATPEKTTMVNLEKGRNPMCLIDKSMSSDCNPSNCIDLINCDSHCDDSYKRDFTCSTSSNASSSSDISPSIADIDNNNVVGKETNIITSLLTNELTDYETDVGRSSIGHCVDYGNPSSDCDNAKNNVTSSEECRPSVIPICDQLSQRTCEDEPISPLPNSIDLTVPKGCRKIRDFWMKNASTKSASLQHPPRFHLTGKPIKSEILEHDYEPELNGRSYNDEPIQLCKPERLAQPSRYQDVENTLGTISPSSSLYDNDIISQIQKQAPPRPRIGGRSSGPREACLIGLGEFKLTCFNRLILYKYSI